MNLAVQYIRFKHYISLRPFLKNIVQATFERWTFFTQL